MHPPKLSAFFFPNQPIANKKHCPNVLGDGAGERLPLGRPT